MTSSGSDEEVSPQAVGEGGGGVGEAVAEAVVLVGGVGVLSGGGVKRFEERGVGEALVGELLEGLVCGVEHLGDVVRRAGDFGRDWGLCLNREANNDG